MVRIVQQLRGALLATPRDERFSACPEPIEATAFEASLRRIRELDAPIVLSSHLPPATGMLDVLLGHVAAARSQPRFVGPDQAALAALLASLAAQPEPAVALESPAHG